MIDSFLEDFILYFIKRSEKTIIMDRPADDLSRSHYRGSHIFSFAAKYTGLPIDQFNFFLAEMLALIFAICFRRYLPPKPSNLIKRHLIGRIFFLKDIL